ncbi:MAG: TatD family hydrolase, partial [Clostridia bacterium]|nr:TatD family hydrolase [Clostridia bacterium]
MAPVPKRGSRCDSSMISITAQRIAEIRGCTAEDIIELTAKNASRLFSVDI